MKWMLLILVFAACGGEDQAQVATTGETSPCGVEQVNVSPNADCSTPSYVLCPVGAPNPFPRRCMPGMRVTDPEVWCCE